MHDIITVSEAAEFLHKHPSTIRHWIETNKLKARHISAGGHGIYVIVRSDLLELVVSGTLETQTKHLHEQMTSAQRRLPFKSER
jgi:excisionase family DNA binding protein